MVNVPGGNGTGGAGLSRRSLSAIEGVRTAREMEAQMVWDRSGVQDSRPLGCTSKPVKSLCSNFDPTVRRNWSTVTAVGRGHSIFGALSGEHPLLAHEAGDAVAPSRAAEGTSQPRTTVGLTTERKLLANALAQANVLAMPAAR